MAWKRWIQDGIRSTGSIGRTFGRSAKPVETETKNQGRIMTSREYILQRIRTGLTNAAAAGFGDVQEPPVPEVWPRTGRTSSELFAQFSEELNCSRASRCDARSRYCQQQLVDRGGRRRLLSTWLSGSALPPRTCTGQIAAERIDWSPPVGPAERIEQLPAAAPSPPTLLADTGSCVVHCARPQAA